jgi:hypothetical protein
MAISSTLCGGVLVENGQKLNESGTFVNQQWLWYNVAAIAAAILGGQLVQHQEARLLSISDQLRSLPAREHVKMMTEIRGALHDLPPASFCV